MGGGRGLCFPFSPPPPSLCPQGPQTAAGWQLGQAGFLQGCNNMELTQPPPSPARKCQCLVTIDVSWVDNLPALVPAPGTSLLLISWEIPELVLLGEGAVEKPLQMGGWQLLDWAIWGSPKFLPPGRGQAGRNRAAWSLCWGFQAVCWLRDLAEWLPSVCASGRPLTPASHPRADGRGFTNPADLCCPEPTS